jgi:hypothetical protein
LKQNVAEVESVTGIQFIETGDDTFHEEMHYFDNLAPSDDIPNHLLLLYLNTGLFLMITGILMIVKDQNLLVFCGCLVFFGSLNIIVQARLHNVYKYVFNHLFQIIEIEKNEDSSHEEVDMIDVTNRYLAIAVGMVMILMAGLILLLWHRQ